MRFIGFPAGLHMKAVMHIQARFATRALRCLLLFIAAADRGTCQACGSHFQPPCPGEVPCPVGILDESAGLCAFDECGVPWNSCCPSIDCGTEFFVNTGVMQLYECRDSEFGAPEALEGLARKDGVCLPCGGRGEPACQLHNRLPCRAGSGIDEGGVCVECGGRAQPGCLEGDGPAPCADGLLLSSSGTCGDEGTPNGNYGE